MPKSKHPANSPSEVIFQAAAIVPAAGSSMRFGAAGVKPSKQFQKLGGFPLLVHVLRALERSSVNAVYIAAPPGRVAWVRREIVQIYGFRKVRLVIKGGKTRGESVQRCVERIPESYDILLVHDSARPLVTPKLINQVAVAAYEYGAALAAIPETDTIKRVQFASTPKGSNGPSRGWTRKTIEREALWRAQTPQAFRSEIFRKALLHAKRIGFNGTDDASYVERAGERVRLIPGDVRNLKVTNPEDLLLAEALQSMSKTETRSSNRKSPRDKSDNLMK